MIKPPKRPRDLNQWAKHMVDLAPRHPYSDYLLTFVTV
jgi:hypothetical protein